MKDISSMIRALRRPVLLIRAARAGALSYNRKAHLRRVLSDTTPPRPAEAALRLIELEAEINEQRITNAAHYSVVRHVDVMVALLGEAQLLRHASRDIAT